MLSRRHSHRAWWKTRWVAGAPLVTAELDDGVTD
jgi:hypothetical protein